MSFLLLPLMHSENITDHEFFDTTAAQLLAKYTEAGEVAAASVGALTGTIQFEAKHVKVIKYEHFLTPVCICADSIPRQFGRYPHRNDVL